MFIIVYIFNSIRKCEESIYVSQWTKLTSPRQETLSVSNLKEMLIIASLVATVLSRSTIPILVSI